MPIVRAESDAQILATCRVMRQLRPHLPEGDGYLAVIRTLMADDGYRLAAVVEDGEVRAAAGYRMHGTLYAGRVLMLDDLVSDETERSRGHGAALLAWLRDEARAHGCRELHLLSNTVRERAHRFYFREGMAIQCFHFRAVL
ncbi:GNAT family N-acetyltransferase [Roseisolibacter agri]|uniref:N-acetyltransferase GCN5 n=1 Tax=Roseisolibacter agri TaxID=2014610 RepID=A0AA37QEJ5_9BACT|nr:GNAT family N-acetyltransferase [Roseisolibacter agri]GLC24293.1 N-acetyltransferase GCN5 [Roseisolibacter agri]